MHFVSVNFLLISTITEKGHPLFSCSPRPVAGFKGPYFLAKGGEGKGRERGEGDVGCGKRRKEGKRRGRGG